MRDKARKEKEEEERKNENICLSEFLIIKGAFRDRLKDSISALGGNV